MEKAIRNFARQLEYKPAIENAGGLKKYSRFAICGMGGSNLAGKILRTLNPELPVILHRSYGLPRMPHASLNDSLIIAISYSGNTEETIDAFTEAWKNNVPVAVVATGGKLIELAKKEGVPFIELPAVGIQPRMALGYMAKALLTLMGDEKTVREMEELGVNFKPADYGAIGKALAKKMKDGIPLVYASGPNFPLAYAWKIKFNETAKVPAFANMFPELNHNEIMSFAGGPGAQELAGHFRFILIKDEHDDGRIVKRMNAWEKLFGEKGFKIENAPLSGKTAAHKAVVKVSVQ